MCGYKEEYSSKKQLYIKLGLQHKITTRTDQSLVKKNHASMSASPTFIQGKHWTYSVVGTKLYLLISDINWVVEFCILIESK